MIRWRDKVKHRDVYDYYRGLIALRCAHPLFRLETAAEVRRAVWFFDDQLRLTVPPGCVAYLIEDPTGKDSWSRAIVLLNATARLNQIDLPEGNWQVFGDSREVSLLPLKLRTNMISDGNAVVAPRSALILGEPR